MATSQIRDELTDRNIDFSDCFDKDSLIERLTEARAGLIDIPPPADPSPPPAVSGPDDEQLVGRPGNVPPHRWQNGQKPTEEKARVGERQAPTPRGAAKGTFEFGAETRQGDDDAAMMEEAFRQAGWSGQADTDPSQVDEARSPGLQRNFADVSSRDFRKPYTRGN